MPGTSKIPCHERCEYRNCRHLYALRYLGERICAKHWGEICRREAIAEAKAAQAKRLETK